jgi:hypothetical protein
MPRTASETLCLRSFVLLLAALALCCGRVINKGPSKQEVTAALQSEAASMKRDGEKLDPSLGVKATWNITGVDVQEQAGNSAQPYKGSVKFKITSRQDDPIGPVETHFEKTFNYVYDAKLAKWLFKP